MDSSEFDEFFVVDGMVHISWIECILKRRKEEKILFFSKNQKVSIFSLKGHANQWKVTRKIEKMKKKCNFFHFSSFWFRIAKYKKKKFQMNY